MPIVTKPEVCVMSNSRFKFGFSEVSMLGGVALLIASHTTAGIILIVLGTLASIIDYALKFQQEREAQEKIAKLTEEIANAQKLGSDVGYQAGSAVAQLLNMIQQHMQDGNDDGNSGGYSH